MEEQVTATESEERLKDISTSTNKRHKHVPLESLARQVCHLSLICFLYRVWHYVSLPHFFSQDGVLPVNKVFKYLGREVNKRKNCISLFYLFLVSLSNQEMNESAQYLVGYHDYRNFCKMDVGNGVVNFCRRILSVSISLVCCDVHRIENPSLNNESLTTEQDKQDIKLNLDLPCKFIHEATDRRRLTSNNFLEHYGKNSGICNKKHHTDGYDMCVATIEGEAFLWHQVRAIMAILFLVGEGKEKPDIVKHLLDVENHPRKPQYCLASDVPLNLYGTTFEGVEWQWDNDNLLCVITQLQALWMQHSIRSTMIRRMLWDLEGLYGERVKVNKEESAPRDWNSSLPQEESRVTKFPQAQSVSLIPGARTKVYKPLLSRPTCESLETRVEHYIKRQRLDPDILQKLSTCNSSQKEHLEQSCSQVQE
nr:tRNA pseudouridine(38/39) synthase-like [Cherax quadricarinatus]